MAGLIKSVMPAASDVVTYTSCRRRRAIGRSSAPIITTSGIEGRRKAS